MAKTASDDILVRAFKADALQTIEENPGAVNEDILKEAFGADEDISPEDERAANAYFKRFDLWASLQHEMGQLAPAILGRLPGQP